VRAREYYLGIYETAAGPGEILTAITVPISAKPHGFALEKLKRKVGDDATAAAAVVLTVAHGRVATCAIGLGIAMFDSCEIRIHPTGKGIAQGESELQRVRLGSPWVAAPLSPNQEAPRCG
jgi:CO/xanthine dehydrogenase FAD-binding subunit